MLHMLLTIRKSKFITYVGYTSNLTNRIKQHNNSKGAKFTRGSKWKLIFHKKYRNKKLAMINEYKLKKDYKLRSELKTNYLNR